MLNVFIIIIIVIIIIIITDLLSLLSSSISLLPWLIQIANVFNLNTYAHLS